MRSLNGGWHGLAGWGCFRRFPEASAGLRSDDGANSLSNARSSVAAADIRLAELRHVSEIPGAAGFPRFLAGKARGAAVLCHRGAFAADQAGGASRRERSVSAALRRRFPFFVLASPDQRKAGGHGMARQKAASRSAARPAVKKKWTGLRGAAKTSSRKAIKSKGRGVASAKPKARPKQRIAISHHREEDFKADGLRAYAHYRHLGIKDATQGLA